MQNLVFVHNAILANAATAPAYTTPVPAGNAFILRKDGTRVNLVTGDAAIATPLTSEDEFAIAQIPYVTDESVRRSAFFKASQVKALKLDVYSAGTKQVTTIGATLPITGKITLKVVRVDEGYERFPVKSFEITAGGTLAANVKAIAAVIKSNGTSIVNAQTNATKTVTLAGTASGNGVLTIVINGVTYLTTITSGDTVTVIGDAAVAAHAAAILAAHGLIMTNATGVISFVVSPNHSGDAQADYTYSASDTAATTTTTAADGTTASTVTLTAKELGYSFRTMLYDSINTPIDAITETTAPTPGIGTPAHVLALQESASGLFGGIYQTGIVKKPTVAEIGARTFDILRITISHPSVSENMLKPLMTSELVLAVKAGEFVSGTNLGATAETRLKTFFGLV